MAKKLLDDEIRKQVSEIFESMRDDVKILFLVDKEHCEFCDTIERLLEELTELTDRMIYEKIDASGLEANKYKLELTPAMVPLTPDGIDRGIRFYGIPSGHEFGTFLKTIVDFSSGAVPDISNESVERLKSLEEPVDIKVFVTTSCPYCPKAVLTAFNFAYASPRVTASMVEASEFEELSKKFRVSSVPQVVINSRRSFVGAYSEAQYLDEVMKTVSG